MNRPTDDELDQREEYWRARQDDENEQLSREAGCDNQCPADCDHIEEMLHERQERRDEQRDYYASRGVL